MTFSAFMTCFTDWADNWFHWAENFSIFLSNNGLRDICYIYNYRTTPDGEINGWVFRMSTQMNGVSICDKNVFLNSA